jgi:protein-S-isoprenylcysteine O-methyltransferase Ste14
MYRLWIFLIFNIFIIYVSWHSFRNPHSHGFFRFFAFESILIMALWNSEAWFLDPFSVPQVISWLCLAGSAVLALHGFYLLRSAGAPQGGIEATTLLLQHGAYRYIRHPIYASLLLCGLGIFMKQPSLVNAAFLAGLLAFVTMAGRVEEEENKKKFGQAYVDYMVRTKMFVPFLY